MFVLKSLRKFEMHAKNSVSFRLLIMEFLLLFWMRFIMQRFHEQDTEVKKDFYSRKYGKKVFYQSNCDLYQSTVTDWRDTFLYLVPPHALEPEELPAVCRYLIYQIGFYIVFVLCIPHKYKIVIKL